MAPATTPNDAKRGPGPSAGRSERLTGRGSEITYQFEDFELLIPSSASDDATHAKWKMNGVIKVRTRVTWKSVALIAHAWALILGSIALVAVWPNPLTFVLAVALIGSPQPGQDFAMQAGAHRHPAHPRNLNIALTQRRLPSQV